LEPKGDSSPGRKTALIDLFNKTHANIVGFQETKRELVFDNFLKSVVRNKMFVWNSIPAIGTAGGILMGVDIDVFDILSWETKEFLIFVIVKMKAKDLVIRIITVYGSSYEDRKEAFISELHSLFVNFHGHTIIGGDFNLVRFHSDKSNGVIDHRWSDKFNDWVEIWSLLEVKLSNRRFTWRNNQENLIMSNIDRVFCNVEVDQIFPLASIRALPRLGSDHTPILWESGCGITPKSAIYHFEKWWLMRDEFKQLAIQNWTKPVRGKNPMDIWQEKIRRFRTWSKGWSKNIEAELRNLKKGLMEEYDI
jgi:mannosylglycoprotein endo-beta-mannosidase